MGARAGFDSWTQQAHICGRVSWTPCLHLGVALPKQLIGPAGPGLLSGAGGLTTLGR